MRPPENIRNLSASILFLWIRTTSTDFTVWSAASIQNLNYRLHRGLSNVLPIIHRSHQKRLKQVFWLLEGYTKTSYATLYKLLTAPTNNNNVKTAYQTSLHHIKNNLLNRLGLLLSTTHDQRSQQDSGQTTLQPVLINKKPKFLKATRHAEIREKLEQPRSMAMGALSW